MSEAAFAWLQFGVCAGAIAFAGARLSFYGDVIAEKTGWSGGWVGLMLLATVTSLPELAAGISAVALAQEADIAVGNVLGSCMFNLAMLAVVDLAYRRESVYRRASQGHILSAGFGIVMAAMTGYGLLLGHRSDLFALGHVGIFAPAGVLVYLIGVRTVFFYEIKAVEHFAADVTRRYEALTLRQAASRYAVAAGVVVLAGAWLPFTAQILAATLGWDVSFVGTVFVAMATTLPEFAVTISALRLGSLDMAIANLLGSNMFNIAILGIDDLFYTPGPLLAQASPIHAVTVFSVIAMSGLVVIGLLFRPVSRPLHFASWVGIALIAIFLLNSGVLFSHGQ